jgi:hypothetical protein
MIGREFTAGGAYPVYQCRHTCHSKCAIFIVQNIEVFPGNVNLVNQFQCCTAIYDILRHCVLFNIKLHPVIAGFCIENDLLVEFNFDVYHYFNSFCVLFGDLSLQCCYKCCVFNMPVNFTAQLQVFDINYHCLDFIKYYLSFGLYFIYGDVFLQWFA